MNSIYTKPEWNVCLQLVAPDGKSFPSTFCVRAQSDAEARKKAIEQAGRQSGRVRSQLWAERTA